MAGVDMLSAKQCRLWYSELDMVGQQTGAHGQLKVGVVRLVGVDTDGTGHDG